MDPNELPSDAPKSPIVPNESRVSPEKSGPVPGQPKSLASVWQQTLNSRTAVLGTLFLVTGAIGLPMVWYSPVFSKVEKWFWSFMAIAYTSALIGVTWAIVYWCYRLFRDMF